MAEKVRRTRKAIDQFGEPVAGNGLLHRRAFLAGGAAFAGAAGLAGEHAVAAGNPIGTTALPSQLTPGKPFSAYGMPAPSVEFIKRIFTLTPGREGTGSSRTPHQFLNGSITPSGLHFERHHNGVPEIDAANHKLLIHGLVQKPLMFTLDTLMRYPMVTVTRFVECAGNSGGVSGAQANPASTVGDLHGLVSCSEWTGVPVATLLDEAGVQKGGTWTLAEGADAASLSRSIPMDKMMDDAIIALYQNGEPVRPEQGFPMRLLVPGFQGNLNIKWLRRIKVTDIATMTRDETSKYTELMPDGKSRQFLLEHGVKSIITRPSTGINLQGAGLYEISGLAWSGAGRVTKVEVSADAGRTWAEAALTGPVSPKALTRFRMPWKWSGQPAILTSRATDEKGSVQPGRNQWLAQYAQGQAYMYNGSQAWGVAASGETGNVFIA
ncbi:MAG: sulfite dehydrogenase [Bauldia sp.]